MFKDLYESYCKSRLNKDSLVKTRKKINKDENKLKLKVWHKKKLFSQL